MTEEMKAKMWKYLQGRFIAFGCATCRYRCACWGHDDQAGRMFAPTPADAAQRHSSSSTHMATVRGCSLLQAGQGRAGARGLHKLPPPPWPATAPQTLSCSCGCVCQTATDPSPAASLPNTTSVHSLANQPDAGVRPGSQRCAAHAKHRPQQALVRPLCRAAQQPGRLRDEQHASQAGAAAGGGQPAKGLSQQQPAEQCGDGGAKVEDDWEGEGRWTGRRFINSSCSSQQSRAVKAGLR